MWLGFATFRSYPHPLHALSPISATAQRRLQGLGAAKCLTFSRDPDDPLVCHSFPWCSHGVPMKMATFSEYRQIGETSGRQGHRLRRSPSTPFHAWSAATGFLKSSRCGNVLGPRLSKAEVLEVRTCHRICRMKSVWPQKRLQLL